jgi:ketosteroid isomerase-like protein
MTMTRTICVVLVALSMTALSAQSDPQALPRMVATERAFAAATAELGVRDGFLTFFADDAVQLTAGATGASATLARAKDGLRQLVAPKLPLASSLMWEPFTGQISADGTFGWLTGAYVNLTQATHDIVSKGAYFSVWKRQADGTWRVWLDEGVSLPATWNDASPFRVAPDPDSGTIGTADETLDTVERSIATGGDWRARLAASVRLHRDGQMPLVGREAAAAWAPSTWRSVRYTVIHTEAAASGDLAVTAGGYDATSAGPLTPAVADTGTWLRVWKRDVTGRWRIVFESSKMKK